MWAGIRWHDWVPVTRVWCIVLWNHLGGCQCVFWSPGDSLALGCTYQVGTWKRFFLWFPGSLTLLLNIFSSSVRTGMNHRSAFVKHKRLSPGGLDMNVTAIYRLIYPHRRGKIPFCTVPGSTNRVGKCTVDHQKSYNYECLGLPTLLKKVDILSPWVVVTKVAQTDSASQESASG